MATVIYFSAHPDDETLMMGCSIREHLAQGHDVHVVCMTDGGASGVRTKTSFTDWLGRTPTKAEFSERRIAEFHEAVRRLGVSFTNRHTIGLPDGGTTFQAVYDVIAGFLEKYPDARLKGHSWIDAHRDHHNIGKAMLALREEGRVLNDDVRWYINREYMGQVPTPGLGTTTKDGALVGNLTDGAAAAYKRYHKTYDWWGIGYRSTSGLFNALAATPFSKRHAGPEAFASTADRQASDAWVASKHACCA